MFRSTARDLRTWWTDFSDDILGADLVATTPREVDVNYHLNHPHRAPMINARPRRQGAVPARIEFCLSPVHQTGRQRAAHHESAV